MNPEQPTTQGFILSIGAVCTEEDRKHKSFKTWYRMLYRCHKDERYLHRKPSAEWYTFANFVKDMGERPDGLTLDRIDNEKPYGPNNCRWATMRTQNNNRGSAIKIEYKGKVMTLSYLAEHLRVSRTCLLGRIRNNWPEDTWGAPAKEQQTYTFLYRGKASTVADIATSLNVPLTTLRARIKDYRSRGLSLNFGDPWPESLSFAKRLSRLPGNKKQSENGDEPQWRTAYLKRFYAKHSHLTPPPTLTDRAPYNPPHDTPT